MSSEKHTARRGYIERKAATVRELCAERVARDSAPRETYEEYFARCTPETRKALTAQRLDNMMNAICAAKEEADDRS